MPARWRIGSTRVSRPTASANRPRKRAKLAATKDPWLKAEGTATRPSFVLRDRPVGLAEEAQTAMRHENNLGGRIAVLRDFLARGQDDEVRAQILDVAQKTVEESLGHKKDNHAHILDGILFLEEHGRKTGTTAAVELRALLVGPDGALHPAAIDRLATQLSREHAVKLLPEAIGEHWVDRTLAVLPDVPNSVLENVVQAIVDAKGGEVAATVQYTARERAVSDAEMIKRALTFPALYQDMSDDPMIVEIHRDGRSEIMDMGDRIICRTVYSVTLQLNATTTYDA